MAKGRKHVGGIAYRRERLLGTHRYDGGAGEYSGADLSEEEVWSVAATDDAGQDERWEEDGCDRWPARSGGQRQVVGGLSLAFDVGRAEAGIVHQRRSAGARRERVGSAPVDVPRWRQGEEYGVAAAEEGGIGEWMPPHEYLAREQAKAAGASVLEGAGRTLKGRDMSRVRDAVWSQTGYYG